MPYEFTLTAIIPATAQEIYDAWLDSAGHSQMTGGAARMSSKVGAEVSAWDGYIAGRNLELVPGERIVQSWRTTQFTDDHEDSVIAVTLEEVEGGTLVTLVHANVPDGQTSYQQGGWQKHYFDPMAEYFGSRKFSAKTTPKARRKPAATKSKSPREPTRSKAKTKSKKAPIKKKTKPSTAAKRRSRSRG
jgi:uncharacterized protein YndB with AHSA1/START domain